MMKLFPPTFISIVLGIASILAMQAHAQDETADSLSSLISNNKYQQVLDRLEQSGDLSTQPELLKIKALSHLKLQQYETAEQHYLAVMQHDDGVDVRNNLGLVYLRQSRFAEAINQFQNTIRRFPDDSIAYKNLGDVYLLLAQLSYKKGAMTANATADLTDKSVSIESLFAPSKASMDQEDLIATEEKAPLATPTETSIEWHEQEKQIMRQVEQWAKARAANVSIIEPAVEFLSNSQASVVFDEWAGFGSERKRTFKLLSLNQAGQEWQITEEKNLFEY